MFPTTFCLLLRRCMKMYQSAASMFKNKKVLILGFGREGMSTYRFLRNMYPDMHLTIADKMR